MELKDKKVVLLGGAGLIGSHSLDRLLETDVGEIVVFDNFARGSKKNIENAMKDTRVSLFEAGGDILQRDVLMDVLDGVD